MQERLIGVLADTHDRLPDTVFGALEGVDEIWHLGDVMDPQILLELDVFGVPLTTVRGNNDGPHWPVKCDLERNGLRFHLVHIPPRIFCGKTDFLLHGHTHVPRNEMIEGVRWLNPGSAGLANKGAPRSVGRLKIRADGSVEWELCVLR
jgi:putative phosphoesterase